VRTAWCGGPLTADGDDGDGRDDRTRNEYVR